MTASITNGLKTVIVFQIDLKETAEANKVETMDKWAAYNEAYDIYETKVAARWQELQKTPYYREKKVS